MIYDLIIIGGGAAGLFAGASLPRKINGLILEKSASSGIKLLMTGSGQCNLTHNGSIKDFLSHYGTNGKSIRSILYQFNNDALISFFEHNGISTLIREDGKVFPKSLRAKEVLNCLSTLCANNGLSFVHSSPVTTLTQDKETGYFSVACDKASYRTKKVIVTTGGCSYPITGSDGNFFPTLSHLGIPVVSVHPALTPIFVQEYPYASLSGISFPNVTLQIQTKNGKKLAENNDSLLFTHKNFSGPVILNSSRYASSGLLLCINYTPSFSTEELITLLKKNLSRNQKQLLTVLQELLPLPKRFLEVVCERLSLSPSQKFCQCSGQDLKHLSNAITKDSYSINGLEQYNKAMVTAGGVALSCLNLKTMECKDYPGLYFAGETLDIDGDTGGYNLQFAFSSAHLAAQQI